ncbi:hypothetical protein BHU72_13210 [Desulfuribacillus stibiiarsenatis]|uniref:Uncharacterized protein n=1 Tax=Desulfuribacillus stibiiarsenatis TaxID=1390249 RepID=A0A1E5L8V5_9FIRM|nr:hypothetical protein [Desulfuribacillus stibiiarsenatis]OEH86561.1 hypothetical protein BHU72_13210 [Desulfuribacillus stibiiarsenatis]
MSRNTDKASQSVFNILKKVVQESEEYCEELDEIRWVYGDKENTKFLTEAQIVNSYEIMPKKKSAIIAYEHRKFFVTSGFGKETVSPTFLDPFEINPGLFTLIIHELEVNIASNVRPREIINEVMSSYKGICGYTGHDFKELLKYFETICIFEILPTCPLVVEDIESFIGLYLCYENTLRVLPFSKDTLEKYMLVFEQKFSKQFKENILVSLSSTNFKYCYLDLYRCIEMLYPFIYLGKFYENLEPTTLTMVDLAIKLHDDLAWKPVERNAIKKIIDETPAQFLERLTNAKYIHINEERHCGDWIYDIRNSIVHLRHNQKSMNLEKVPWDMLVIGMLDLLEYWYNHFSKHLLDEKDILKPE